MGNVIFRPPVGLENWRGVAGGAVVTCNHLHPADNYGVYLALRQHFRHKPDGGARLLWRVVAEANYSMPGVIGFAMRYADTLPVSTDAQKPHLRLTAHSLQTAGQLLVAGKKILIFPEGSMWRDYQPPRPLKMGAFRLAAKNQVPVLPCFYIVRATQDLDADGFPVPEYTLHILPPIYPDPQLAVAENALAMCQRNTQLWQACYQKYADKAATF